MNHPTSYLNNGSFRSPTATDARGGESLEFKPRSRPSAASWCHRLLAVRRDRQHCDLGTAIHMRPNEEEFPLTHVVSMTDCAVSKAPISSVSVIT